MMRTLHKEKGATLRIEILTEPTVQNFITTHADTLDSAFKTVPMSDAMRRRLQRSDYIFSGIKTFHEINEAFPSLLNTDGTRKPFTQFLEEVKHIDKTYNQHYLAAEFNFAQASAAMAAKWEQYAQDGDRYLLQYRTAGDDRVRPEHASLEGVTLPITDTFWEEFYPPNGWNCRCTVTQVLKSQATPTPHEQAIALGEDALKLDKHRFFRHNSGITGKTFPDYNPYTIQRCRDCDIAKGKLKLGKPSNEVCEACRIMHAGIKNNSGASERITKYDENKWERSYVSPQDNGFVVTQKERIAEAEKSTNEGNKYKKEKRMTEVLANNGYDVEYLRGENRPSGQTYDILMNGIKADLKCINGGAGNIVKYASKAFKKQGADAVVFEFPSHDIPYYKALAEVRRKFDKRIFFYFKDEQVLKEIKNEASDNRPRGGTRPKTLSLHIKCALQKYAQNQNHQTKSRKK